MNKKVLTVDVSKTMREIVAFILSRAGYKVLDAEGGLVGLRFWQIIRLMQSSPI